MALTRRNLARGGFALLLVLGLLVSLRYRHDFDAAALHRLIGDTAWAPLLFILLHIVVSLAFIPRTIMGIAAGLIWGLWFGTLWAMLGLLAGAITGFLIARYLNSGFIQPERLPGFRRLMQSVQRGGWRAVTFLRLVPVMPHTPVNYAFGLTDVGLLPYCLGTILGSLPMTVFYVDLGSIGDTALTRHGNWIMPTAIGIGALLLSILLPKLPGLRSQPR